MRGLNTAATLWCAAAIGAISGLGRPLHALIPAGAVLVNKVILRPLAYKLHPAYASGGEQDVTYAFELACRQDDALDQLVLRLSLEAGDSLP